MTRVWLSTNDSFFKPATSMIPQEDSISEWFPIKPSQELQINPLLSLGMEIRGRLIRTGDKVVLYDNTWQYEGGAHLFAEWAANDAQLFAEEFEHAYDGLANQVVTDIF